MLISEEPSLILVYPKIKGASSCHPKGVTNDAGTPSRPHSAGEQKKESDGAYRNHYPTWSIRRTDYLSRVTPCLSEAFASVGQVVFEYACHRHPHLFTL